MAQNEKISKLPPKLTHFTIDNFDYICSDIVNLPPNLTYLKTNNPPTKKLLPKLKNIIEIKNLHDIFLPSTYLHFNDNFNKSIFNLQFILNLKTVIFGNFFNQSVSFLPLSITHLEFGQNFNAANLLSLSYQILLKKLCLKTPNSLNFLYLLTSKKFLTHLAIHQTQQQRNKKKINNSDFPNLTHLLIFTGIFRERYFTMELNKKNIEINNFPNWFTKPVLVKNGQNRRLFVSFKSDIENKQVRGNEEHSVWDFMIKKIKKGDCEIYKNYKIEREMRDIENNFFDSWLNWSILEIMNITQLDIKKITNK